MSNLTNKAILDNRLMKLAKVDEIRHVLAHTNKGDLCLMLKKGETEHEYRFVLDAVPFETNVNRELLEIFKESL